MATRTRKKLIQSEKPITYTKVSPTEEKEDLASVLSQAGTKANELITSASYIIGSEDTTPEFMPTKPETGETVNTPENPSEPDGEQIRDVNSFDDLFGAFSDIDKKFESISDKDYYPEDAFKDAVPDSLELEKYDVPEIDEEKLRNEVTESETAKTEIEKNNLKQENEIKTDKINKQIDALKSASEEEKQEIQEIYDEYKVNVENDAIKRGLARSSVAVLSMENIEGSRAKELSRVAENLTKSINDAEQEILALQKQLEISLNNLDLELAENINTKLASKIETLENKRKEAIKFNNEVEKLQTEYKQKIAGDKNTVSAIEERLEQEYAGSAEADKREQKLQTAINYFSTMDRSSALKVIINSPELAQALGEDYYALYYYIMRQ